ncbi:hypothetical protein SAMN05519103_01939 [Rhizobiales bacterium GAS113]|nr:hypothetical protein SAMN05519103_01939 [Rhizobiales bacterium GAS113]
MRASSRSRNADRRDPPLRPRRRVPPRNAKPRRATAGRILPIHPSRQRHAHPACGVWSGASSAMRIASPAIGVGGAQPLHVSGLIGAQGDRRHVCHPEAGHRQFHPLVRACARTQGEESLTSMASMTIGDRVSLSRFPALPAAHSGHRGLRGHIFRPPARARPVRYARPGGHDANLGNSQIQAPPLPNPARSLCPLAAFSARRSARSLKPSVTPLAITSAAMHGPSASSSRK